MEETTARESLHEYCDRLALFMPKEMKPFLEELAIPCDCGMEVCRGWRLSTMLRAELPVMAATKQPEPKGSGKK